MPFSTKTDRVCAGATDASACTAAMSRLHDSAGSEYLATTAKDDRVDYTSLPDLAKFLGKIDTASEAAPIAHMTMGPRIACGQHNAQKTAEGFRVLTESGGNCGADIHRSIVLVTPDGAVTVVETMTIKPSDPSCEVAGAKDS